MDSFRPLIAFVCGFVIAQLWKFIEGMARRKHHPEMSHFKTAVAYIMRSGGMPSGHAACMTAITTYFVCSEGANSAIFALSLASTIIILYDAIHVRYATGIQGEALNKILRQNGAKPLPVIEGHTPFEVFVGVLLGIIVGFAVFFLF